MKYIPLTDNKVPYDQYFGLLAEKDKGAAFLEEELIFHRLHGGNQSRKLTNAERLRFRMDLWKETRRAINKRPKAGRAGEKG